MPVSSPLFTPKNAADWRKWLQENHETETSVWLVCYKTKSPKHNISWSDAVDEALCFGWIDSTRKTIDDESFKQYYSCRKAKSNWSKINKEKVEQLIANGKMTAAGLKSIEVAKENGSWTILDSVEDLVVPNDLKKALSKKAYAYFDGLSNSAKKILLYWVMSAKREETRQKRITEIAKNAALSQKPKAFR